MIITAPLVAPNDYDSYALQEIILCLSKPRNCKKDFLLIELV